jgi:hypothetical protein
MATYHVTHSHSADNCYDPPDENEELMALWKQVGTNAQENNVAIKFFKEIPPSMCFSFY